MIRFPFTMVARLSLADGTDLGSCQFTPDFYPVDESLRFRARRLAGAAPVAAVTRIDPIWSDTGDNLILGVRAILAGAAVADCQCVLPITFFAGEVVAAATSMLAEPLDPEHPLHYKVAAYPLAAPPVVSDDGWGVSLIESDPVCGERSLSRHLRAAELIGEPVGAEELDYPVFVPGSILRQFEAQKAAAGGVETGGILAGHLYKDNASYELFAVISALIPAEHTDATSVKLSFSPETWQAARAAVQSRGRGEIWAGWIHSHPAREWCKCGEEAQKTCQLGSQFFSADDQALHRAVFMAPFLIALVMGDRPLLEGGWDEAVPSMYGWRDGAVDPRPFYLIESDPCDTPVPASVGAGDLTEATGGSTCPE